jgi:hypothetical protein
MTRLFSLVTALILAAASLASNAHAGMRVGVGIGVGGIALGALGGMSSGGRGEAREYRERKKARTARREHEEKSHTRSAKRSKAKSEDTDTAEKEPERKGDKAVSLEHSAIAVGQDAGPAPVTTGSTKTVAETESSSISRVSAGGEEPAKVIDTASEDTKRLDCKKFMPSVGMTMSVPCE